MWEQLQKEAAAKKGDKKGLKEEILQGIRSSRIYFGNVLQSSVKTGYMEEYLFRGLEKLTDIEDKIRKL